jgi:monoamine oxidase
MDVDIVVMGAGFAGITAARDLQEAGARVVILEARDRIGGRTWYREIPGTGIHAEYGGMFFSRETQPHLAAEIARYGVGVDVPAQPAVMAWVRGATRVEGTDAFARAQEGLARSGLPAAIARATEVLAADDRRALVDDDIVVREWVSAIGADDEAADYLRAFLAAMGGAAIERISMLPLLWDMAELGYDPIDAYVDVGELFTDGTKSLLDPMAEGLDIRHGAVVRAVEDDGRSVTVTTETGDSIRVSAAIFALPLNCWDDVTFTGVELPEPKRLAAKERHVGEVSKVLAVVEGAPPSFLGMGWDTPVNAGFLTRRDGAELCMGFSVQDRVDLGDHDAVAAAVRAHLPDVNVTATAGHDWVGDPFSKGTWLAIPPGWFTTGIFGALSEPIGRIAFAGSDIAEEGAGWIEGAVQSGKAAAVRSLATLGRSTT